MKEKNFLFKNKLTSNDTYILPDECRTTEMEDNNRKLLMDIYERLENERDRNQAINQLNLMTKAHQTIVENNDR